MFHCRICRFDVDSLDDMALVWESHRGVCVRCYYREIGDPRRLTNKTLRRDLATEDQSATLRAVPTDHEDRILRPPQDEENTRA